MVVDDTVRLTEEQAAAIYSVLMELGGAPVETQTSFQGANSRSSKGIWLCLPKLGGTAKFVRMGTLFYVTIPANSSDEIRKACAEINTRFVRMNSEWFGRTKRTC